MTSRELIKRTLEFDKPVRVPRQMWLLPWADMNYPAEVAEIREKFADDIVTSPGFAEALPTKGNSYVVGESVDEWGCVWVNVQAGVIGEIKDPIVREWADVEKLREPIEALTVDRAKVNEWCKTTDKFVMANCCPRPFERLQFLRGTENVMMDLAMGEDGIFALLEKIHKFYLKEVELWCSTDVDGLMFMDDWGAQRSLLISPAMWRELFKPLYKEYIDIAHANGKKTFMHSDGYIVDILGDLIELGLDAVNSQIFCMGLEELEKFRGKITFWGEIDRQHILPEASEEETRQAVRDVQRCLCDDVGVIGQLEFGPGAKPENVRAAFDEWENMALSWK